MMELLLANPRGYCAGVERAISVVEELLQITGPPVYVRHAIVHNHVVTEDLTARGAVFVEDVEDIPFGAVAVMSAHGVGRDVMDQARDRELRVIDGTCPLVTKVQLQVLRHSRAGRAIVIVGHRGHVEVAGLIGHCDANGGGAWVVENEEEAERLSLPDPEAVAYVTQTTLAVSQAERVIAVLKRRFPAIHSPHGDTICYATQSRQDAVRALARQCGKIVVIGAPHSSNSRRLAEVAEEAGVQAFLVERPADLSPEWFAHTQIVGVTASASAPEHLVTSMVDWFQQRFSGLVLREVGEAEDIHFRPPSELRVLREEHSMATIETKIGAESRESGLNQALRIAGELAEQVRTAGLRAAEIGSTEAAMLVTVAEDLRDRTVRPELLAQSRDLPVLGEVRNITHRGVDLAFDGLAVVLRLATDALDGFLRTPRPQSAKG